jgi:hypothetical protein
VGVENQCIKALFEKIGLNSSDTVELSGVTGSAFFKKTFTVGCFRQNLRNFV